ncbi:right-handed parallel beta-helix repeat-containing protein [Clostridium ganghwense]|uniref:Right-handed parallel beta-helix repeat-containing protein n=1 Tax=Clostridium ganghwense TaxID=312089 RepID=A0ABT4CT16_9CLOT|nr:right-handed parallel beta-helix repeat-containing protein [Clostridium ganghwense]MCY6372216.1 right-handed parallel beta-helix repeat-containing protein [Clostridium ganghwense]
MATIYVPDDYTKIQDAVDAASPGDKIRVKDGSYNEEVSITKDNLHIIADGSNVVLDGSGTTFLLDGCSNVKIEGFTIRSYYTGIKIYNGSNNTISQCAFSDISGYADAAGVRIYNGSNNTICQCAFSDIKSRVGATGVRIYNSSNNTISQCDFTQCNTEGDSEYAPIKLEDANCNDITKNRIWDSYNGIILSNSHNNNFISNQIWSNTGIDFYLENSNNNLISRNLIDSNGDRTIYIKSSINNSISRNMIRVGSGSKAIVQSGSITLSNNSIEELTP